MKLAEVGRYTESNINMLTVFVCLFRCTLKNLFMSALRSVCLSKHTSVIVSMSKSMYVNKKVFLGIRVYVCLFVLPYSRLCECSFMVFQTFVFLIFFTSKGHMESWGPSTIWALIEERQINR